MNEKIQELALQAGEYVNSVYQPPVRSKTPGKIWEDGHIGWHTQFNQKFAEALIKECAEAILDSETKLASYYVSLIETRFGYPQGHFGDSE